MNRLPPRRQKGMVIPLLIIGLAACVIAAVVGIGYVNARSQSNAFKATQSQYLRDLQSAVQTWYERHLTIEADAAYQIDSERLMAEIGMARKFGVTLILSTQLTDGVVRYRKVAIVSPGATSGALVGTSGYGQYLADGSFQVTPGFTFAEFDGKALQYQAMANTNKALESMAAALEQYVGTRMQLDPGRDSETNFFLPKVDCTHIGAGEMPCTEGRRPASEYLSAAGILGTEVALQRKSAWGTDLSLNNDRAANSAEPPYTMTVSAITPWGTELSVKAVQPIY